MDVKASEGAFTGRLSWGLAWLFVAPAGELDRFSPSTPHVTAVSKCDITFVYNKFY